MYVVARFGGNAADDGMDRQLMYTNDCAMLCQLSSTAGSMKKDSEDWYNANVGAFKFPIDSESEAAGIDQTIAVGSAVGNAFSFNCQGDEEMLKACFKPVNTYYASDEYKQVLLPAFFMSDIIPSPFESAPPK